MTDRPGGPHLRGEGRDLRRLQRVLPATPASAWVARVTARVACRAWRVPEIADTAVLVASELVTIAIRHAGSGRVLLRVLMTPRRVRLEVHDASGQLPTEMPHGDECSLQLVEAVTARCGVEAQGAGTQVWAEIGLPESTGSPEPRRAEGSG